MHDVTPSGSRRCRPWADLPPDLLTDISGRLHDVGDKVRFHAVCSPWRDTSPFPLFRVTWTSCDGLSLHSTIGDPRRLSFPSCYSRNYDTFARLTGKKNWVASSNGTAAWFFIARPRPRLVDLVTRDVTLLPRFPDDGVMRSMEYSRGIVYGDGTLFLHSFSKCSRRYKGQSTFTAAILCPGHTMWKTAKKELHVKANRCTGAMYHDGKVLVFVDMHNYFWCVLTPGRHEDNDIQIEGGRLEAWMTEHVEISFFRDSYFLESHNELHWVTIFVNNDRHNVDWIQAVSVDVHMLERSNKGGNMRWMRRSGRSLSDRVLFLGSPASFTMDVSHPGGNGGCVYFVYYHCVFRYSLVNRETKVVERLRPGWGSDKAHVWLRH